MESFRSGRATTADSIRCAWHPPAVKLLVCGLIWGSGRDGWGSVGVNPPLYSNAMEGNGTDAKSSLSDVQGLIGSGSGR